MTMRSIRQTGKRQRRHAKSSESQNVLTRLTGEESSLVLHMLLKGHEPLREEAEKLATEIVSAPSCEDIASEVADAVTSLDIQELNGRAGATRYGYTEPTDAAWQLLEEAVEDFLADMKRRAELGLTDAAITMCRGIVAGLYAIRSTNSDGPLGWAPDFPAEEAGHAVSEVLRAIPDESREAIHARLLDAFTADVPDWAEMLTRAANEEG